MYTLVVVRVVFIMGVVVEKVVVLKEIAIMR
jgi:hypothetical protein